MYRAQLSSGPVLFIIISAVVFLADFLLLPGHILVWGAKTSTIWAGEWYRLITANFLHSGITHILFNMYALYIFGRIVENLAGRGGFFAVYLIGGVSGFLASLLANPEVPSVGASAAVFALMGYTIHFRLRRLPIRWLPMDSVFLQIFGLNIIMGFVVPNIDHFAHIGGFVGGFFTAGVLGLPASQFSPSREKTPVAERVFAGLMIALFFWGGLAPLSVADALAGTAPDAQRAIQARYGRYFTAFLVADPAVLWTDPTSNNEWIPLQGSVRRSPDSPLAVGVYWRWVRGQGAGSHASFEVTWERHTGPSGWQVVRVDEGVTWRADPGSAHIWQRSVISDDRVDNLAGQWRVTVEVEGKEQYRKDFSIVTTSVI